MDREVKYMDVVGWPGYRVGDDGSVWSRRMGNIWRKLKPAKADKFGHLTVTLCNGNGKPRTKPVHRLVCEAFHGPCPNGMQCCHGDGDPTNNAPSNLRWDSSKANHADSIKHGTSLRGEKNGFAKLSVSDVYGIRLLASTRQLTQIEIAKLYSISKTNVKKIHYRQAWAHLPEVAI